VTPRRWPTRERDTDGAPPVTADVPTR
jgi:hypothetical protein